MQGIDGQEFLTKMVRQLGRLFQERHSHGASSAGVQNPPALKEDTHAHGWLVVVNVVQKGIGFFEAALQTDGPPKLGCQLGAFVGVVSFLAHRGAERRLGGCRIAKVPKVVQCLLIQHQTAPDQRMAEVFRYAVSI
ncbi:hypothetical protein D3C73_1128760 [compost metagenome]